MSLGFLLRPRSLCVLLRPISCNDGPTAATGASGKTANSLAAVLQLRSWQYRHPSWWHGALVFPCCWLSRFESSLISSRSAPPTRDARDGRKGAEDPRGDLPLPPGERETQKLLRRLSFTATSMLRRNSRRRSETDRRPAQVGSSPSRPTDRHRRGMGINDAAKRGPRHCALLCQREGSCLFPSTRTSSWHIHDASQSWSASCWSRSSEGCCGRRVKLGLQRVRIRQPRGRFQ